MVNLVINLTVEVERIVRHIDRLWELLVRRRERARRVVERLAIRVGRGRQRLRVLVALQRRFPSHPCCTLDVRRE